MERVAALLARAVTTRANVVLEGGTAAARTAIAQGIHARSWQSTGRLFVSLAVERLPDDLPWGEILAGNLASVLKPLGLAFVASPHSVGTIHLNGLHVMSRASQEGLATALKAREDAMGCGACEPRLIGSMAAVAGDAPVWTSELRVIRALGVLHVSLDPETDWTSFLWNWAFADARLSAGAMRLEWW